MLLGLKTWLSSLEIVYSVSFGGDTKRNLERGLMLNSRFCAPKLENSEVVTIKKLESVFCAQFEFRTQTTVNKSQTQ